MSVGRLSALGVLGFRVFGIVTHKGAVQLVGRASDSEVRFSVWGFRA